ncbi:uncharacterized protein LOC123543937 [Mercenaria mercenaria]|uniref:uncharacterized protein LOC123543937 n=1 Tax=Mercenaria mercenaria TaxID=6596 RepID=UPI00234E7566|nr:uncharacterized protein LOC123543937 [Mercenaria mercenaria]
MSFNETNHVIYFEILLKKSLFYLYTPISVKVTDTGAGKVTIRIVIMEVKLVLALVFCTCVWLSDGYNIDYLRASRILEKYAKSLEENAEKKGKSYRAQLQGDLCNFSTYDIDQDGVIEKDELLTISAGNDAVLAVLDLMADNKSVMPEEFYALVPMFIPECPDSDQK